MKKIFAALFFTVAAFAYGQEKFALVIGNANYANFGTLRNSVNDANDMEAVLRGLGFTVEKVIDGSLTEMENAAIRLKNRLSESGSNAYGFFFYAGHGLEMGGTNYLIPANANIPDRNFLRERAFSVQIMLDMLNDSRNALNIVVLDACRDFPAAWSRSVGRGLAVVSNPPANHIIMYATGAGTVANDGTGRNGLFTGHLLNNLRQPDIDVNNIFRLTMSDVARASNNEQRPALYTDFAETVYFGTGSQTVLAAQGNPPQSGTSSPAQPAAEQPKTQQPAGSSQLQFTTGQKIGAGFGNMVFGLGSFIMGDSAGGLIVGGVQLGGFIIMVTGGLMMPRDYMDPNATDEEIRNSFLNTEPSGKEIAGAALVVTGAIIYAAGEIYGFARPFSYDRSLAKKGEARITGSSNPMQHISFAPVPVSKGMGLGVFYRDSF